MTEDAVPQWSKEVSGWKDEIATVNNEEFQTFRTHADTWRSNALKMEDARFGRQYSKSEARELLAFRQAPMPISVLTAICDTADAMMVSAKPTVHVSPIVFPHNEQLKLLSKQVASKYSVLIEKGWYDSLGNLQYDRVSRDATNTGHGLFYVVPRNEFGEFLVDVKHLSWRYYFPDPSSKDPLYQDMDNMIYAMPLSFMAGYKFVKSIDNSITEEQFLENFAKGSQVDYSFEEDPVYGGLKQSKNDKRPDVLFIQRITLEEDEIHFVVPLDNNLNASGSELGYRTYPKLTDELLKAKADGRIRIVTKRRMMLCEYTSIGNLGRKKKYPTTKYNIVPMVYDHRDTPYPYSRSWYLYPAQRTLNKFVMTAVLNSSLMNSMRVIAEEKSILNMKEWISTASMPGSVLRYRLPIPGVSTPPEIVKAEPMSEAWLTFPRYLTYMMEYISGIFGTMMGDPKGSPDVFSTVASLQSAGGQKIKRRMTHADATLSVVGEVMGEFYKEYAPPNGYTSVMRPGKEDEVITYNTLKTEQTTDENGNAKVTVKIDPKDDLSTGFRSVRFTSQASAGYESATEALLLTQLATQLKQPALIPEIIDRVGLRGGDEIRNRIDVTEQLKGQLSQIQNSLNESQKENKIRSNQIFQLAKTLEQAKFKGKLDVELEKFKNDPVAYLNSQQNAQGER